MKRNGAEAQDGSPPTVSVIMPLFNKARFVEDSVRSVVSQSFTDWELIIVDDASRDLSFRLVQQLAAEDVRIKLLCNEVNIGAAKSRNKAIAMAAGRYIAFLDADDLWRPEKLACQIGAMQQDKLALCYTDYLKINEHGEIGKTVISVPNTITYHALLRSNSIPCLTAVYDSVLLGKQYFPDVRSKHDRGLWPSFLNSPGHEDYAFWLTLFRQHNAGAPNALRAKGINRVLAYYREHKGSLSGNKLHSSLYQWHIYRNVEHLGLFYSAYLFHIYAFRGLLKYLKW